MRRVALAFGLVVLAGCGGRVIARVQAEHGREFRCDHRYVRAERVAADRWQTRGCGFEADWTCRDGACVLGDSRAHGMSGP